ncbi:hypothetical protein GJ904_20095 [Salmonella enterica]|nr:hypothetical protein [Salmonella enterica subsp. enterica serovar Saintpaul]EEC1303367.1 hypothetical protein [Salmonella enterica]
MNNRESTEQRLIWAAVGLDCTLYRVNTGRGYVSGLGPAGVSKLTDNSILMKAARPIPLGFINTRNEVVDGVADLNGWTSITITPEMVGQTIAVFTSVETKRSKGGVISVAQHEWKNKVTEAGGIAFVANSAHTAKAMLSDWLMARGAKLVDKRKFK